MMSANPALSGACAPSRVERSVSTAMAGCHAVLDRRGSIAPRIFEPFLNPRTEGSKMGLSIIRSGMGSRGGGLSLGPGCERVLLECSGPIDPNDAS
jgi:nitrogen-specific signal transduction histidine kinase